MLAFLQHRQETSGSAQPAARAPVDDRASRGELDSYIELLYEELPDKIRGATLILQLAQRRDVVEDLVRHDTLMGAPSRLLKDHAR